MLDISKLLAVMVEHEASDLYLTVDSPPMYRINGVVRPAGNRCLQSTDTEALAAFRELTLTEGIMPALESSHAVAYARKLAPTMRPDQHIIVNLSGRGDKDIHTVAKLDGISLT